MRSRLLKFAAGVAALVALALGGAAIAGAGSASDDEGSIGGSQAQRARVAALAITGGGTANAVERDSEHGGTFEVEVTKPDGSTVDVRLDGSYGLVVVDSDSETTDSNND